MGKKISDEDRKRIVEERGYELLEISREKEKNGKTVVYVTVKCKNGHVRKGRWCWFLSRDCPCYKNEKYDLEIKKALNEKGYELIKVERKDKRTYITIKCDKGHITTKIWQSINTVPVCKNCQRENNIKWSKEDIINYVENKGYKFITIKNESGLTSRIEVWCGNPSHSSYEVLFGNFKGNNSKNGTRCPHCNESSGEKEVSDILNKYNIEYIPQYKFNDCKFYNVLKFDFYLPEYNCCIEYDGGQHFEMVEWFGGFDGFANTIIRDTIKNEYCKKNNIKLIRIPYWEFDNIEEIIVNKLKLE